MAQICITNLLAWAQLISNANQYWTIENTAVKGNNIRGSKYAAKTTIPCSSDNIANTLSTRSCDQWLRKWIRYHQEQSWGKYSEDDILNVFEGGKKKMVLISEIAILMNWSSSYKSMVTAKASCAQHYSRQTQQWCTARRLVHPGHSYAMFPFSCSVIIHIQE